MGGNLYEKVSLQRIHIQEETFDRLSIMHGLLCQLSLQEWILVIPISTRFVDHSPNPLTEQTMNIKKIAVLPGDGIGQEVVEQAVKILRCAAKRFDLQLELQEEPVGGTAYDLTGTPLPERTLEVCQNADAVLLGAVGGPKWESLHFSVRPERALLGLRSELGLYANLRPAQIYGDLVEASTLKKEVVEGTDIMVIRELTGGIYFGEPRGVEVRNNERVGFNTLVYSESEIERIARVGFETARKRSKKLTSSGQTQRAGIHGALARSGHGSFQGTIRKSTSTTCMSTTRPCS